MSKRIFIPTENPEDWKALLAEPEIQWKTGFSAKCLAYCWHEAKDFPKTIKNVFTNSGIDLFINVELLLAIPEYKVMLPGGARPSQNDVFALAKGNNELISIMVEGKVRETFGKTINDWIRNDSKGKQARLKFLVDKLNLKNDRISHIRYQLLHRTASAILEAKRFAARNAVMLVHSFSQSDEWFSDYASFVALFDLKAKINSLQFAGNIDGIALYFAWIKGDKIYLAK